MIHGIWAGGTVVEKVVQAQEVIITNMACLAGFSETCGFQIVPNPASNNLFGNRALSNVKLTGPGERCHDDWEMDGGGLNAWGDGTTLWDADYFPFGI